MTYTYLYQTSENKNVSGTIKARNREAAYTLLRKQGIRPYRIIGDDPSPWRKRLLIGGSVLLIVVLSSVACWLVIPNGNYLPSVRHQIEGDQDVISQGALNGWPGVFSNPLDEFLSYYAQPGWMTLPPLLTDDLCKSFEENLDKPLETSAFDKPEIRQLHNIVNLMREEMQRYVHDGGTVRDYLEMLEERQMQEIDRYNEIKHSLDKASDADLKREWLKVNLKLKDAGFAPLPKPKRLQEIEAP